MRLRDIIVGVDEAPSTSARINLAVGLAIDHDAHLTGLAVTVPLALPSYLEAYLTAEMRAAQQAATEQRLERLAAVFTDAMARAGWLGRSEWRTGTGDATEVAALHARTADLLVVGQPEPDAAVTDSRFQPEELLFETGRPLLVVPYAGRFTTLGRRVLIAWNGSRETARAVGDALPLLERATLVTLLEVDTGPGGPGLPARPGTELARHLAHHDIAVDRTRIVAEPREVGNLLLNQVSDLGCDLIVMGGYGHSRLRGRVLGSLTGFILRHMTVPVLISH